MQNFPAWITQYGPWFLIVFLLILNFEKVSGGMQKVVSLFVPNVAEKLRHSKEQAKWKRDQVEREYIDTVKSLKDFVQEMKSQAQDERARADKQREEWQARFDERDRISREERALLHTQIERLMEQRTDMLSDLTAKYERLETRNLDWQQRHTELLGSMMRRLDQMALILAGRMGFDGERKDTQDNTG